MSDSLPKYYFRDIPAYLMDEIIAGMIEGKTEPTPEEMEEWLASDLERTSSVSKTRQFAELFVIGV